ncbi:MAG: hypothetical protein AABW79_02370 [Nanoarchaeota archaeon]
MKKELSKSEAREKIREFFEQEELDADEVKKIKRLAMKFNIKLDRLRARFCKRCCVDLKDSKIRVSKNHKTISCKKCNYLNKIKIS